MGVIAGLRLCDGEVEMVGEGRGEAEAEEEGKEEGEVEGEGDPLTLSVPRRRVGDREEREVRVGWDDTLAPPAREGVEVGVSDPPTPNPAVIVGVEMEEGVAFSVPVA